MLESIAWAYTLICTVFVTLVLMMYAVEKLYEKCCSKLEVQPGLYALITGCDSGFGNNAAHELNRRGVHVFAACFTSHAVQAFIDDVTFKGTTFLMDVTKEEDIKNATVIIKDAVRDNGLHLLFNNAGVGQAGPIELLNEDELRKTSDVNLWGQINVTKAMLPMIKIARGRIINTTSVAGRISPPYWSPYTISKYGFEAFSDSLRHEMKPWGVSVHIIEPGFMRTNIYRQLSKQWQMIWDRQPKEVKDAYGEDFHKHTLMASDSSNIDKRAANPQPVLDAYVHAALSKRPRLRYLIGFDAHIFAYTIGLLPTHIGDFLWEKIGQRGVKPAGALA